MTLRTNEFPIKAHTKVEEAETDLIFPEFPPPEMFTQASALHVHAIAGYIIRNSTSTYTVFSYI